jgi:hypothetical protein
MWAFMQQNCSPAVQVLTSNNAGRHVSVRSKPHKVSNLQAPDTSLRLLGVCVTTGHKFQAKSNLFELEARIIYSRCLPNHFASSIAEIFLPLFVSYDLQTIFQMVQLNPFLSLPTANYWIIFCMQGRG